MMMCAPLLLTALLAASPAPTPTPRAVDALPTVVGVDGPVFAVGSVVRVAVDGANLRRAASTDHAPIGVVPWGGRVTILEAAPALVTIGELSQRWYRVRSDVGEGWRVSPIAGLCVDLRVAHAQGDGPSAAAVASGWAAEGGTNSEGERPQTRA